MVTVGFAGHSVGAGHRAYLIAEIGINHGGDLDTARRLVAAAAEAGADAVKLQTYVTELRVAKDSPIFGILKQCELSADAHAALVEDARGLGIDLFSTPFDEGSVELLAELGVPGYKIASFDIVNLALVERVAKEGRPVIVSRGMATLDESDAAVALIRSLGAPLILLHCVSSYPLDPFDANLSVMDTLRQRYEVPVGFSDHTAGIDTAAYAVARGANVIEKHFTLDRGADGPDHAMSADPPTFAAMVRRIRDVETILGSPDTVRLAAEEGTVPYRRPSSASAPT